MRDYKFTHDWFNGVGPIIWPGILKELKGKPNINFLEIGSFEGRSAVWLIENILTDPTSTLTCIDTFQGSREHPDMNVNLNSLFSHFQVNIHESGAYDRVRVMIGRSDDMLPILITEKKQFEFVYIDGSHNSWDVLFDTVCSFKLLKKEGVIVFDDYRWPATYPEHQKPGIAIDSFLKCFKDQYQILSDQYQLIIKKP